MKNKARKVLVIGLDGATFDLIRPWAEQDKLPTLKRLMDNGTSGELRSTIPPFTAMAWTSLITGTNPGKHGIFDFFHQEENSYQRLYVTSTLRKSKGVWHFLNDFGKKVGLVNIPMTYPPEEVDGFMVSGFPNPELKKDFTYPTDLVSEIEREVGEYRIHLRVQYQKNAGDAFLKEMSDITDKRAKATLYLMNKYKWDFFMVVFQSTDWIEHFFWKYMDEKHPDYDPTLSERYGDAILRHYQKIDGIMEKILENIDDNTTVVVVSDHGMGPLYKSFYPNNWLCEIGLLNFKKNFRYLAFKLGITPENIYKILLKLRIVNIAKMVTKKTLVKVIDSFLSFSDVDWSKTKVYTSGCIGQLFVNLKGREPEGIVEPGKEYEDVRDFIIQKLRNLRDPDTGELVVENIFKKEEAYFGEYADKGPDVIFLMKKCTTHNWLAFGSKKIFGPCPTMQSGFHKINGIFIAAGKNIRKGERLRNAEIIDVAPTILHIMGAPIPDSMDGKVLKGILKEDFLEKNPIKHQEVMEEERVIESKKEKVLSEEEEEKVKERLRGLGYLVC